MQLPNDQNHQDTENMSVTSNSPNYKTQLCHQWLTNGQCPRAQSCNYAHGTAEIRQRYGEGPATLYKNSLCKFWQGGSCSHGDQCMYAHGLNELRTSMSSSTGSSTLSSISSNIFPPTPSAPSTLSSSKCQKDPQFPLFHPSAPNAAMFMSFLGPPPGPIPPFPPPPSFMAAHPPPLPQTFLMSNPQPPGSNPFTLWGQPPPPPIPLPSMPPPPIHPLLPPQPSSTTAMSNISSPTSLNSLLKREHFQPFLTGGGTTNSTSSTSNKTILQQPADGIGDRKKENDNEGTNKSSPAAIGSTKTTAVAEKLANNLICTGHQPPLIAERHRSRSSSIPSKSAIPLPFTMAQIAQQFENVNFFDGSSKDLTNTSSTPDFNTSNDADFPSLNCATKKEEEQKVKNEEKPQKPTIDEAKTLPTPPPPIEQPKSFAKIAAKTPIAFSTAAMANKTKSSKTTTTVKHSASAGAVISVQQQKCGIKHLEGTKKPPPQPSAPPPPAPTLALVNKAIKRPAAKTSTPIVEKTTTPKEKHANSVPSTPFLPSQLSSNLSTSPPPPTTTSLSTNQKNDEYSIGDNKFDDLFEKAPFLNHARNIEESMFKSIEGNTITSEDEQEEEVEDVPEVVTAPVSQPQPQPEQKEEEEEVAEAPNEWQTVVSSRHRKSSLNAEYLSHRPSPCTDDGYQEGFSSGEEYGGHSQQTNQNGGMNGRMADSPASISQQSDGTMVGGVRKVSGQSQQQQQSSNEPSRLDKSHIFYRTHICLFWQNHRDGKGPPCKHGDNCFYAHGEKKLVKLNPIYFKTTLCEAYNNGEQCPYGNACNFAHGEKDLRKPAFNGLDNKKNKFFSVPHRHQLRKQRGMQTVHCIPTIAKPIEKVVVIKTNHWENNKK